MTDGRVGRGGRGFPLARKAAVLVLADGTRFDGHAFGAPATAIGEVCFNTAITGYQEILADPSYAGQIVAFTFPHIGIVGTNDEDIEVDYARGTRGGGQGICRCAVELSRDGDARPLDEAPQHPRDFGNRHAKTDGAHPRDGHAARRDRAR